jgi:hypothetical protein
LSSQGIVLCSMGGRWYGMGGAPRRGGVVAVVGMGIGMLK